MFTRLFSRLGRLPSFPPPLALRIAPAACRRQAEESRGGVGGGAVAAGGSSCGCAFRVHRRGGIVGVRGVVQKPVSFVPPRKSGESPQEAVGELARRLARCWGSLLVITGAGVSTASGIPDYRGPEGSYSKGHVPMTHSQFVRSAASRARYWARSLKGFDYFSTRLPNSTHRALAEWQRRGLAPDLITQNVDRLHRRAGHAGEIEIHGNADELACLQCGAVVDRRRWTKELRALNRDWMRQHMEGEEGEEKGGGAGGQLGHVNADIRADGDAHLVASDFSEFVVPSCSVCGDGVLMPTVREAADAAVARSGALLVLGSTCQTLSVFRLLRTAAEAGKPVYAVTMGETRADELLTLKIEAPIDEVISQLNERFVLLSS